MPRYKEVNEMPHCGSCGKLLAPGVEFQVHERRQQNVIFCSDRCVMVFDTYKEPKYGDDAIWPESVVA